MIIPMEYIDYRLPDDNAKTLFAATCEMGFRRSVNSAADAVLNRPGLRFIALAGPTCSGKTTTAGILADKLSDAGRTVRSVSIDDFFLDREVLVAEAEKNGTAVDLDSAKAIDIDGLSRFVDCLENGLPGKMPVFDFGTGRRSGYRDFAPSDNDIFIFEGIQAVYPEVVSLFPGQHLLRIFISVTDGIDSPFGNWLPREIRLLRRLVRDSRFRNTDAETTFAHWDGVAANEIRNIEPYRDGCDIKLDSGMAYELPVLKDPAITLLRTVEPSSRHYIRARMLAEKLGGFPDMSEDFVPKDSVLREFIG